jgi:hypothetical protein
VAELRLVVDADVPLHRLADRLRQVGHWVPPDALEQAIDAAIGAAPPALQDAVGARLRDLGCDDGPEERAMFARLLEMFAARAPRTLGRIETAVDTGDADTAGAAAARLARQADALGAAPLARLCAGVARAAVAGHVDLPATTRGALRRELAVTCRVLAALAADLVGRPRLGVVPG